MYGGQSLAPAAWTPSEPDSGQSSAHTSAYTQAAPLTRIVYHRWIEHSLGKLLQDAGAYRGTFFVNQPHVPSIGDTRNHQPFGEFSVRRTGDH